MSASKLTRSKSNAIIGGVCAGLANYFGWDATLMRVIYILLFLLAGTGVLLYLILWIIMPAE